MSSAKDKLGRGELVLCMGLRQARTVDIAMIARRRASTACTSHGAQPDLARDHIDHLRRLAMAWAYRWWRPLRNAADWISRVLGRCAQGLIVPHVSNAKQAQAIVSGGEVSAARQRSVMARRGARLSQPFTCGNKPDAQRRDAAHRDDQTDEGVERATKSPRWTASTCCSSVERSLYRARIPAS